MNEDEDDNIFKFREDSEPVICNEEVVDEDETPTWMKYLPKNTILNSSTQTTNNDDQRELRPKKNRKIISCNVFSETHQRNKEATILNKNKLISKAKANKVHNSNNKSNRIGKFKPVSEKNRSTNITELNALMTFSKITK